MKFFRLISHLFSQHLPLHQARSKQPRLHIFLVLCSGFEFTEEMKRSYSLGTKHFQFCTFILADFFLKLILPAPLFSSLCATFSLLPVFDVAGVPRALYKRVPPARVQFDS